MKSNKAVKKIKSKKYNCSRDKLLSKDGKEFMTSCAEHIAKKFLLREMAVVGLRVVLQTSCCKRVRKSFPQ